MQKLGRLGAARAVVTRAEACGRQGLLWHLACLGRRIWERKARALHSGSSSGAAAAGLQCSRHGVSIVGVK